MSNTCVLCVWNKKKKRFYWNRDADKYERRTSRSISTVESSEHTSSNRHFSGTETTTTKKTLLRNIVYATQRTQHMLSSLLFLICALRPIILHLQTIQIQSLQLYFSVYFQLSVHWGRDRIKFQLNLFFVLWIVACSRAQRSTHITNEIDFRVFYFDIWLVDVSGVEWRGVVNGLS